MLLIYWQILFACLVYVASVSAQTPNNVVAPPSNLKVEGLSPIDKATADKISRYTASRSARILSWQPRKREMLISTRFGETTQVHRVLRAGGARTQLTFLPESVSRASYQPTGGDYFIFLKDQAGDENFHLFRQDFATGDYEQLTSSANEIDSIDSFDWLADGSAILYVGVKLKEGEARICLINPTNAKNQNCVAKLKGILWQISDISPDNSKALLYEYIATGKSAIHLLDLKTGGIERLTPDVEAVFSNAVFGQSGRDMYLTSNEGSEFERLVRLDIQSKKTTSVLPAEAAELESFALSPDGKASFVTNQKAAFHTADSNN